MNLRDNLSYGCLLLFVAVVVLFFLWLNQPVVSQIFSNGFNLQGT